MSWAMIVIGICIVLAVFGVCREYMRFSRRYLAWRIIAVLIAVFALACLALPLSYKTGNAKDGHRQILLTTGFNRDSLKLKSGDSIYTLDPAIHKQYGKAVLLSDVSQLDGAGPLHIFGYGLSESDLELLDKNAGIIFHPSPLPQGIIGINWTDRLQTGETFVARFKYNNLSSKKCKLILKGLNTTLDSVGVRANKQTDIILKTNPKQSGKAIFHLLVIAGNDTLEKQSLPVVIHPIKVLNVLMLSAAPDFEFKFLKTWLGQHGYGVALRSTISKGKYSQDFINIDQSDLSRLSASLLSKYDVVISDAALVQSLNDTETAALQQLVTQGGLGVIIKMDTVAINTKRFLRDMKLSQITGKQSPATSFVLPDGTKTAELYITPASILVNNNTQVLVTDEQQHAIALNTLSGAGKLIFTTLSNTYNWQLSGNKKDYDALWSLLITKAARKPSATANWQIKGTLPQIGSPAQLVLESGEAAPLITVNSERMSPQQNSPVLFEHLVVYRAHNTGWQQARANNTEPYWWYAWDKNDWQSLQAADKLGATASYAKIHQSNSLITQQIISEKRVPVPKFYFFILFLMAVTFLWAETKFFNT